MNKIYFGFAIADGMFPETCGNTRQPLATDEAAKMVANGVVSCCNPSHQATIAALESRHGIRVEIPEKAPVVKLETGDRLIVFSPRGLPRLEGRHEYTSEEIEAATFVFGLWEVK